MLTQNQKGPKSRFGFLTHDKYIKNMKHLDNKVQENQLINIMRKRYDDQLKKIQSKKKFEKVYKSPEVKSMEQVTRTEVKKEKELLKYFEIKKPRNMRIETDSADRQSSREKLPEIIKPPTAKEPQAPSMPPPLKRTSRIMGAKVATTGLIRNKTEDKLKKKEVQFNNFDMSKEVQTNYALDNRDSYDIQQLFKKDENVDRSQESSRTRAKRLKEEEEANKKKERRFLYYDEKNIKNMIKSDLEKRLEARSKRNIYTNRDFDEFQKKKKDREQQEEVKKKMGSKIKKLFTAKN